MTALCRTVITTAVLVTFIIIIIVIITLVIVFMGFCCFVVKLLHQVGSYCKLSGVL